MNDHILTRFSAHVTSRWLLLLALLAWLAPWGQPRAALIPLADQPIFSAVSVPGNLALVLSVEAPTATTPGYRADYDSTNTYLGYFDPNKCYRYSAATTAPELNSYFYAAGEASAGTCSASLQWSGNFLNWASMQSLDNFRWVLTGGHRLKDTPTETLLQKTFFGTQSAGRAPDKTLSASSTIAGATPMGWKTLHTSIASRRTSMLFSSCAIEGAPSVVTLYTETTALKACSGGASPVYRVYINVKVCDSAPDSANYHNCKQYGSVYKPEGVMQRYSDKLRYAAFGYLNDGALFRDGGVLRARMSYIGPTKPVPGSTSVTNAAPEWSGTTGQMLINPAKADADATEAASEKAGFPVNVPNSGVMNYLNKFGYHAANAGSNAPYKGKDPVSELYYAATRYFRNQGNVPQYSSLGGAGSTETMNTWVDGFPVVTGWSDPMVYSCQKNFILGIGDIYTHRDTNLPGSTIRTSDEPNMPPAVLADKVTDVKKSTDMVGQLEGLPSLGSRLGSNNSSQFIAGLAFHTHTNDIRTDLLGKQTISTYWMDVLEQPFVRQNKYWLAAKYGGFTVPENFSPYAASNGTDTLPLSSWNQGKETVAGNGDDFRPANYFTADDPAAMKRGLEDAFAKIATEAADTSSTSYATASPNVDSGNASYGSSYAPKFWTGDVQASSVAYAPDGRLTRTPIWSAAQKLDAAAAASSAWFSNTRKVITYCDAQSIPAGIRFTAAELSGCDTRSNASASTRRLNYDTFSNVTGLSEQSPSNYLAYLRGSRKQEVSAGGSYRTRNSLLGDIVGSKLLAVAGPVAAYTDEYNPGYSAFKNTYANRKSVLYVGANDGMLHAFDANIKDANGGQELFAFVPSFAYGTSASGPVSGLASLGKSAFEHHFLVNGPAVNFDVDFNRAGVAGSASTADWRSILIGGLGKGGRGYYAMDVTQPSDWVSEAAVAAKVLWEFPASNDLVTRARMGYSFGEPSVVKTAAFGWVVIFSSGYNNDDGKGYFFIVNPKTGALLKTIEVKDALDSTALNMANQRAFIPNYADYTADAIYAGDLRGNIWRLDLTSATGDYPAPVKLAELTNAAGERQPITTRPLIETDPGAKKRYVLVGTGRLLSDTDIRTSSLQGFYAIADGTSKSGGFWAQLPSSSFPIKRSDLNANSDLLLGIGSAATSPYGWYIDLAATGDIAERVDVNPDANYGVVAFAANLPNGDVCNPSGTSRLFAMRIATGKTVLTDAIGGLIRSKTNKAGTITDILIQRSNGKIRINVGDSSGQAGNTPGDLSSGVSLMQLNWREVRQD
jgi:type IV pilus assembly protein PilY1